MTTTPCWIFLFLFLFSCEKQDSTPIQNKFSESSSQTSHRRVLIEFDVEMIREGLDLKIHLKEKRRPPLVITREGPLTTKNFVTPEDYSIETKK